MNTLPFGCLIANQPAPFNLVRLNSAVLPIISAMEYNGIRVDKAHLESLHGKLTVEMADLSSQVSQLSGRPEINLGSGDQLSQLLYKDLGLKQAGKEKLTKSKTRLSADMDVLKAMVSRHPCITPIIQWKVMEKLRSSYTYSLISQADSDSRIHCDFNHTATETNRLSASNPNLQTIPSRSKLGKEVRKAFIASKGNVLGVIDACLHPDTLVKSVYGDRKISDLAIGEPVLSYKDGRITHGKVVKKSAIAPKYAYKLTFDNGEYVVASHDHKWPTLTKKCKGVVTQLIVKKTTELEVGERMVPCREGKCNVDSKTPRRTWYSWSSFMYVPQHILTAEAVHGPRPDRCDVHHKDDNKANNHPDNLEYKDKWQHNHDHGVERYKKQDHTLRLQNLRIGISKRRKYNGANNPNSKLSQKDLDIIIEMVHCGSTARDITNSFPIGYSHARRLVVKIQGGENHKLVKKEFIGMQPMYAITVESEHNYVLSCGVVTMNSQIEARQVAWDAQCPGLLYIFADADDLYWSVAEGIYRRKFTAEDRKGIEPVSGLTMKDYYRTAAKITVLGILYAISPPGLVDLFLSSDPPAIPFLTGGETSVWDFDKYYDPAVERCTDVMKSFFTAYPEILERRREHHRRAIKFGYVWDMWGWIRYIPQVKSVHRWIVQEGLRAAGNICGQAGAAGILKLWMAVMWQRIETYWGRFGVIPLLTVHDEVVVEGPKDAVAGFLEEAGSILENLLPPEIYCCPLKAEASMGEVYGLIK